MSIKMKNIKNMKTGDKIVILVGIFVSLIVLSPIIWIIFTSFKSVEEIYSIPLTIWPKKIVFTNYSLIIKNLPEFPIYFFNTIKVTIGTILLILPLSSATGFALARKDFFGKGLIKSMLLAFIAIPFIIYLVPIYILEDIFKLLDTNLGLILPYTALNLPLAIIIMESAYRELPCELEEAAYIDGANSFQIWYKVLTPLVITSLAAVTIFTFIAVWEEYMFARTLMMKTSAQTLSVGLPNLKVEAKSWAYGTLSAALTLSLLPAIVVFIFLRKYFVEGLLRGSIKG
ncbi:MAG: carbohydrate ABC transporter permease [Atribacterota bacterium]|nr:carbohydrate ABC transporter permease [Atribacterota bacterium]MDD4895197.1 carbohydrate ABC transporter permease [Atribacterota bacterium]MDD5637780.1 carbohydrate ABC transporter permease [Atribacterota bacterium]